MPFFGELYVLREEVSPIIEGVSTSNQKPGNTEDLE
jgi:hypothetical protein